jgi:hypothetical protein
VSFGVGIKPARIVKEPWKASPPGPISRLAQDLIKQNGPRIIRPPRVERSTTDLASVDFVVGDWSGFGSPRARVSASSTPPSCPCLTIGASSVQLSPIDLWLADCTRNREEQCTVHRDTNMTLPSSSLLLVSLGNSQSNAAPPISADYIAAPRSGETLGLC